MQTDDQAIVPEQTEGAQKDIIHVVNTVDENDARRLFLIARNRLVEVNHWHKISTPAHFQLTDKAGNEVDRTAEKGDYIKIDVKAPGPIKGAGYDWVFIESVDDHSDAEGYEEHMAMRVRPASNPGAAIGKDTAHFFTDEATSTFIVTRRGKEVAASVFGRNEIPNASTSNVVDKVRNTIVAVSAIAGLSNIQWRSLVQGLVSIK
jgi:hypothetical protein